MKCYKLFLLLFLFGNSHKKNAQKKSKTKFRPPPKKKVYNNNKLTKIALKKTIYNVLTVI